MVVLYSVIFGFELDNKVNFIGVQDRSSSVEKFSES